MYLRLQYCICLLSFLSAHAQEAAKPEFVLPVNEWTGKRLALWSDGFVIRDAERVHSSFRFFDRTGHLATDAKIALPETKIDDVIRLRDGSFIAAVRSYAENPSALLMFIDANGQTVRTERMSPFVPMRLWIGTDGNLKIMGTIVNAPSDIAALELSPRELVFRTYELAAGTRIKPQLAASSSDWEAKTVVPAGDRVAILLENGAKSAHFVEVSDADGSILGDWMPDNPTLVVASRRVTLHLQEFTETGSSHRLIGYFPSDVWQPKRYFELNRQKSEWIPVPELNRLAVQNNIYASDGDKVLVGISSGRGLGFGWVSLSAPAEQAVAH